MLLVKSCLSPGDIIMKTEERPEWSASGSFIVNSEHISGLFLVFLLLTLNREMFAE